MADAKHIIETLQEIVGSDHVITDSRELEIYSEDGSFVKPMRPLCAVRPGEAEEIQAVVRLANREKVALFPFSSGTTYQGAHIPTERGITVDLRRLNRIDLIDRVARNAIIEPGVTFTQLSFEAKKAGLRPMTPVGVPAEASVLTTYLENTPLYLWPRYKTWETLSLKMILPTGELMGTGQMAMQNSDRPYHWATNFAVINRLFFGAQGTLGIAVKAAVTLKNIVANRNYIFIELDSIDILPELCSALMRQEANDEFFVANSRYLSCLLAKDKQEIDELEKALPAWTAVIGLSGNDEEEVAYKNLDMADVLKKFNLKSLAKGLAVKADLEARMMAEIDSPRGMLNQRRYRGGCAYIACMASNSQLRTFYKLTMQAAGTNGSGEEDLGWMIMPLNFGGSYYFEPSVYYDPSDEQQTQKAKQRFKHMSETLIRAGGFFPRPYPMWAESVYSRMGAYHRKIKLLKDLYDPNNIMNPGKLALR
jgi:FAD/FMN-containing dehydrogenase